MFGEDTHAQGRHVRVYEGFLELPVPVVLAVLWAAGVSLEAACVATIYEVGSVLARALPR